MVDGTRLESGRTLIAFREFESLPLRHETKERARRARSFAVSALRRQVGASLGSAGVVGKLKFEFVESTVKVMRPMWSGPKNVCE